MITVGGIELVNLTPHALAVIVEGGDVLHIPPSGQVARVAMVRRPVFNIGEIPVFRSEAGPVIGLPAKKSGTFLITSALVRLAADYRDDVFSPGELVRDTNGQPIGCRGLEAS